MGGGLLRERKVLIFEVIVTQERASHGAQVSDDV